MCRVPALTVCAVLLLCIRGSGAGGGGRDVCGGERCRGAGVGAPGARCKACELPQLEGASTRAVEGGWGLHSAKVRPRPAVAPERLRGGSDVAVRSGDTLDPEYAKILRERQMNHAQPVGNIEQTEVSDNLPWPEGSGDKRESFVKYQAEYKIARQDYERLLHNLRLVENQQRVHQITIKALQAVTPETACYTPHGRMFLRADRTELKDRLEYQHDKVLQATLAAPLPACVRA